MIKSKIRELISSSFSLFRNKPKLGHRVLIYHSIGSKVLGESSGINSLSKEKFVQHVKFLNNYKTVSSELFDSNYSDLEISITFDDGYLDNLTFAAPILIENKIPFTVFVSSDFINDLNNNCMNKSDLVELSLMEGVTIGSHGKSHCHLTKCKPKDLTNELEFSKNYIEDVISKKVDTISYPYGDVNLFVANSAEKVGYKYGFSSRFDINNSNKNNLLLNRSFIHSVDNTKILKQKIEGDWDWFKYRYSNPQKKV
jgi:peptidoglycan/xylan/chitin deacetylase (PgdA/CDA1 family)